MKSIVLKDPERLSFSEKEQPGDIPAGHALIKTHRIGICGTDLHAYKGKQNFFTYPRILGHELGVEVIEVNDLQSDITQGDRCAVEPYLNCGHCIACRHGKPNCCTDIAVLGVHQDGGMQDYLIVPTRKLHKSNMLTYDQLALVETLGIGAHAVNRAQITKDDTVLIVGLGPIGMTAAIFTQVSGAKITVMDISQSRLALCQQIMKVRNTIDAREEILPQIVELHKNELPTVIIDCTGNPHSMMDTFNYAAHGGRIVFVGHFPGDVTFSDPNFHKRELTLMASRNAAPEDFKRIISLMEDGKIDLGQWITHRVKCDNVIEAFPTWLEPDSGILKAMVEWT